MEVPTLYLLQLTEHLTIISSVLKEEVPIPCSILEMEFDLESTGWKRIKMSLLRFLQIINSYSIIRYKYYAILLKEKIMFLSWFFFVASKKSHCWWNRNKYRPRWRYGWTINWRNQAEIKCLSNRKCRLARNWCKWYFLGPWLILL